MEQVAVKSPQTVKVRLHNWLGRKYGRGKEVTVKADNMTQLLRGLQFRFGKYITVDLKSGSWAIKRTKKDGTEDWLDAADCMPFKLNAIAIDFYAETEAAGWLGNAIKIVIGVVLIVVSVINPFSWGATYAYWVGMLGFSLAMMGVMGFMMKTAKLETSGKEQVFGYLPNITEMGTAKPLAVGERVRCGSVIVGSNYTAQYYIEAEA